MRNRLMGTLSAMLGALLVTTVAGCGDDDEIVYQVEREPDVVVVEREQPTVVVEERPQKVVVVKQPRNVVVVDHAPPTTVIVREPPPRLIVERRPPPPRYAHVWIAGSWGYSGGKYVWVKGRYERSRPGETYVGATWVKGSGGYQQKAGYWRKSDGAPDRSPRRVEDNRGRREPVERSSAPDSRSGRTVQKRSPSE